MNNDKTDKYGIDIKKFNLSYGKIRLFYNFNFSVSKGCCGGIFGPTGTGKTSLLNKIVHDNINGKAKIAYVFQDNKLIENLSVVKNIMLPLENLIEKNKAFEKSIEMLNLVNLSDKSNERVSVLSGGERQRVNIARALSYISTGKETENILLMDEPFSAQDEENRENLIELTRKICKEHCVTAAVVSHNRSDLDKLCDWVIEL